MTLKKIWLNGPLNLFLILEFSIFGEEPRDAVSFDFRVVFEEPFGRPRLAFGFDFVGKVFTAGNGSDCYRPTSVLSQPINVDHQDKGNDHRDHRAVNFTGCRNLGFIMA